MKKLYFVLFSLLISFQLQAQYNNLTVGDPRTSWWTTQGSIEEAVISVKPHGLFLEYGLYLTFSAHAAGFGENDTLEIVLDFALPESAMVTDSWLWIYGDISKGILLDKWTASNIYEDIVNRRKDPSILTKISATQYQLRVFPMAGNETRKVKIEYLVPMNLSDLYMSSHLPTGIFSTSKKHFDAFDLIVWDNEEFGKPSILNRPGIVFQDLENEEYGTYSYAQVPNNGEVELGFNSPVTDGYYLGKYMEGNQDGIYQLAIQPEKFIQKVTSQNLTILVDYEYGNCNFDEIKIFSELEKQLLSTLTPKDSFNLFVSGFSVASYSENLIPATEENIQLACSFGKETIANFSNLISLLQQGIEFANNIDQKTSLLLLCNSDQYGDYVIANDLLDQVLGLMDEIIPIHILDYQYYNKSAHYIGNVYFGGNDYFYINLSHLTHGSYSKAKDQHSETAFEDLLQKEFGEITGTINNFDLSTGMSNGYTYAKFNINARDAVYLNEPIIQVGKFHGDPPFEIEMNGFFNNDFFNAYFEIEPSESSDIDSTQSQIWGGLNVRDLENNGNNSFSMINQIIEQSLSFNVLSDYTAFLCLEDTSQYCWSCIDETELVSTEDISGSIDSTIHIFPNPFVDLVHIQIQIDPELDQSQYGFNLYNIRGELVKSFYPVWHSDTESIEIILDAGKVAINESVYFFVIRKGDRTIVKKLLRQN